MAWLRNQWLDIKGNLKYDLLKTVAGGALIAAGSWIIHKLGGIDREWVEFCAIFAFSALLFFIGNRRPNVPMQPIGTEANRNAKNDALKIRSALYGVGGPNDIDITDSLQRMIPKDALAVRVDN